MMQHLQPNTTLQGGKYRIERVLGQGGFGITYLAVQTSKRRKVVIKELFINGVNDRDAMTTEVTVSNSTNIHSFIQQKEKFKKEAKRLSELNNPHIVRVYDFFEENATAYYSMEYIRGKSLADKLKSTSLSESAVEKYLTQLLDALSVIHSKHLWHLDIKPANILVNGNNVVLIDFGASKQIESNSTLTTSSVMAYTPGFAAPEQLQGDLSTLGAWTDFYALGATIYQLLTLNVPPSFSDVITEGEKAYHFQDFISEKMKSLILWMMRPNRKERPQSVKQCLDALLGERPVLTSPTIKGEEQTLLFTERHSNTNEVDYEHGSSHTYNAQSSFAEHTQMQSGSQSGIWIIVVGIIVISAIIFFAKNYDLLNNSNQTYSPDTVFIDNTVEESLPPDTAYVEQENTVDWSTVENAFLQVMDRRCAEGMQCEYFYYDITGDGLPELWLKTGTCEADFTLYVYTYDNGVKKILEQSAEHSLFFSGNNYIIQMSAHMGYSIWTKITYNGKIRSRVIFRENTNGTDRDYEYPSEEGVEMKQYN